MLQDCSCLGTALTGILWILTPHCPSGAIISAIRKQFSHISMP